MKTKTALVIGIALVAVGGMATTAKADGLSFSINIGVPHPHVNVFHPAPPVIALPRVVFHSPRVVLPVPRVVVPPAPVVVHAHCAPPAPRVVFVPPGHRHGHGHGHPVHRAKYKSHHKHGGLYYGDRRGGGRHGR